MKKLFFITSILFLFSSLQAQITVSTNNYVGVGLPTSGTPKNKLDVNGNIQISNASIPMGIITEVGGTTPLLNLDVNFRSAGYNNSQYMGASFRIDTRSTAPLFQWLYVPVGCSGSSCTRTVIQFTPFSSSTTAIFNVAGIVQSNGQALTSDRRLKKNIKKLDANSLSKLLQLKAVQYNFKSDTTLSRDQLTDSTFNNRQHTGFLAQDVQKIYPELVYTDKNGLLSLDYVSLIPILVESLKGQQLVIDGLKTDLADLKATVAELKKKINGK